LVVLNLPGRSTRTYVRGQWYDLFTASLVDDRADVTLALQTTKKWIVLGPLYSYLVRDNRLSWFAD
jgi:hypothetical protein